MNRIQNNDPAIPFSMEDINGNTINLENYKGQKVFLSFFRKASCPFCNIEVQNLIKNHDELKRKGLNIITFFSSTKEDIQKYVGKQNAPFPIIADPNYEVYKKYSIESGYGAMMKTMTKPAKVLKGMTSGFFSMKSMTEDPIIPADFLIDENMTIAKAYYGKSFDDHLTIEDIYNFA